MHATILSIHTRTLYAYGELEKLVRAETGEVEAADVAIKILPCNLLGVSVSIRSHQNIQLLPQCIHFRSLSTRVHENAETV